MTTQDSTARVSYAIASAVLGVLAAGALAAAVDAFSRCGAAVAIYVGLLLIILLWPVSFAIAIAGAFVGYGAKRAALLAEVLIIAVALAVVGVTQLVPNFNQPSAQQCWIDL